MTAEYDAWKDELESQRKEITDNQKEPRYLLTVYQTGDVTMTRNRPESKECYRRYFVPNASLEDIQDTMKKMNESWWTHPNLKDCSTQEEIEAIPFEEKRWGIIYDFNIEPMTKELEDAYVEGAKNGFFKQYRQMYGTSKKMLSNEEIQENYKDDFEEDTFVIDYSESVKKKLEENNSDS